jgi:enoyl-CoA hydratase/carnithine racemase
MPEVLVERAGPVARVILNRPEKRNAQTAVMWAALRETGQELERDPEVRVVVVSGRGPSFSAGIDLGFLLAQTTGPGPAPVTPELIQQSFSWLRHGRFVTIAAVQGTALGAGMELALACDLRILAQDAILGLPEVNFGILPDLGGCAWLPELVGAAKAKQLIFLAERIDAATALALGIANQVVPNADLEAAVTDLAGRLAARAPLGLAGAKRAINAAIASPDEALRISAEELRRCLASEDFKEVGRAMTEKRTPVFRGR